MTDLVTLDLVLLDREADVDLRPDGHQAWEQLCHSSEEEDG